MLKWAGNLNKYFFFQRRNTNGQNMHEKMVTTLIIKEMQIRTTRSYHFIPAIMVITKRQKITGISEDLGKQNSFVLLVGM